MNIKKNNKKQKSRELKGGRGNAIMNCAHDPEVLRGNQPWKKQAGTEHRRQAGAHSRGRTADKEG